MAILGGEHAELLSRLELFRGLDRITLAKLAAHLEPINVAAGQTLCEQGDPPDGLYLVSRGSFGVFGAGPDSEEVRFSTCTPGEAIGEIALLTGEPRSATVRAIEDGEVLRLDQGRFLELVKGDSSVGLAISAGLIRHLRSADAARLGTPEPPPPSVAYLAPARGKPTRSRRRSQALALLVSLLIFVVGRFVLPGPAELGAPGWHALVSIVALVPILALEALPDGAAALLLVAVWILDGLAPPRVALSGFASSTWILSVCVFGVGAAVAASGLLYRFSLWAVARAGSFRSQVATLGVSGLFLGAAVPNATGRMSLVASGIGELSEAVGYPAASPAAAGLAMAALVGYGQMAAPFLTSSSTALVAFALLPEAARGGLNWGTWALRAAPLHLVLLVGLLAFIVWRYAPRGSLAPAGRALLVLQRMLLGRPTRHEQIAAVVTVVLLVGFATQPWHGVDPAWVAVCAFVVLAGSGVLTLEVLRLVNWSTLLLLGVLTGFGDVFTFVKLDTWVAGLVVGTLGVLGGSPALFVGALAVVCLGLSFVLRWQAAVPLLVIGLSPVARGAGIDPWVVAIIALTACNTFFLPYQSTIYLALWSGTGGKLFAHAQARPVAIAYAVLTVLGLLVSVPVWHAMGLL